MTQTETRYIPVAETAKIVRIALKEAFPGIKFSVTSKSYSMGASIRVKWMDGPTADEVEVVTRKFQGASFDSSVDLKSYHDGELNGESVHFGADYVNCDRMLSESFLSKVVAWYCKRFGYQMPVIKVSTYDNSAHIDGDYYVPQANEWLGTLLYREYRQISEKDVDDIDTKYAREEAEKEAAYQAYLAEKTAQEQEENKPVSFAQNMATFAQAVRTYTDTIVSDYVPQPHDWIYGSRHRPVSPSWARIPEAHYIQLDHKQNDWVFTWVVVPQELDEKTIAGYELELLQYPAAYLEGKTLVTITQELPYNEYHVRVLRAGECTSFRALIGGELKFYLKRYNALLVDEQTFNKAIDARVALKASEAA